MAKKLFSDVTILDGMKEFVGQKGMIVDIEKDGRTTMYRVRLQTPVEIPGVGLVKVDIWEGRSLKSARSLRYRVQCWLASRPSVHAQ
jgi:hypothetical protein